MSRHPFSFNWKAPVAFVITAGSAFIACIWAGSYVLAIATILISTIGYAVYGTGESSDLPGTAGKGNKNVPT